MSLTVVLRAEAEAEFDEKFDDSENARPGRGVRFANRVREVFRRIATNPRQFAVSGPTCGGRW